MPRLYGPLPRPRVSRVKKAIKTGVPASFFVAPTTPFIPARRTVQTFAIKSAPGVPSPHLVDLRTATAVRPHANLRKIEKRETAGLANVTVPRTISHRPNAGSVWNQLAIVAFGHFIFVIAKAIVLGAGAVIVSPLTLGLKLVERMDPDRPMPLEESIKPAIGKIKNPSAKITAPEAATEPVEHFPRAIRPFNMRRALVSFAGTSLAIILPLQGLNAYRTYETIKAQAKNAQSAAVGALNGTGSLADAQAAIEKTRQTVDDLGKVSNAILENAPQVGGMFKSGKALLDAGTNLASAANLLTKSLNFINDASLTITDKVARAEELAGKAEPMLKMAKAELEQTESLPAGVSGDLSGLKDKVSSLENLAANFLTVAPALRNILGETQARRYLVIFQNNAELRPTGGFIGSFAIVDVDRGEIKSVEVPAGGSYDLEGSLKANVLAPDPLRLVRAKWEFQDANWFPDFPTSAKKLTWFYNQSSGPSVDGVIAINAPVLAKLLDAIGPINMPAYGTVATSTTVLATAQQIVESPEARATGKPKQFIADLLPLVLEKMMAAKGDDALAAATVFAKALEQKDIQMQFADAETERAFSGLGWTGEMAAIPAGFDALELVRANIAGAKTDAVIKTTIRHESMIKPNGTITDHVTVTLAHHGKKGDQFTGVRNVEYLRLYVPAGSKLIKASGDIRPPAYSFFDIPAEGTGPDQTVADVSGVVLHDPNSGAAVNNELNRTVFGVWTQTDPGASSTVSFDYELPFTVSPVAPAPNLGQKLGLAAAPNATTLFGFVMEKQSGAEDTEITSNLKLPNGWYPSFAAPAGIANTDGWSFTSALEATKTIGIVVAR